MSHMAGSGLYKRHAEIKAGCNAVVDLAATQHVHELLCEVSADSEICVLTGVGDGASMASTCRWWYSASRRPTGGLSLGYNCSNTCFIGSWTIQVRTRQYHATELTFSNYLIQPHD